jgi:hypothetical protein
MRMIHAFRLVGAFTRFFYADRRRARNSSALNTLQFSLANLGLVLPNRGVAMVYLAEED